MDTGKTLETTLGNLIAALTEETTPFVHDEKEACKVVAFMLTHILSNSDANSKIWQVWH